MIYKLTFSHDFPKNQTESHDVVVLVVALRPGGVSIWLRRGRQLNLERCRAGTPDPVILRLSPTSSWFSLVIPAKFLCTSPLLVFCLLSSFMPPVVGLESTGQASFEYGWVIFTHLPWGCGFSELLSFYYLMFSKISLYY